jgi:hypothetical protein
MADEFDKMAAQLVAHPQYQPKPKPPPLGLLARRSSLSTSRPSGPMIGSMAKAGGNQQQEAHSTCGKPWVAATRLHWPVDLLRDAWHCRSRSSMCPLCTEHSLWR